MKIAVTGAGGYVGQHCVRAALHAGHSVVAISAQKRPPLNINGSADITKDIVWQQIDWGIGSDAASSWLTGCDAVIHAAARVHAYGAAAMDEAAFQHDNTRLTADIAEAARLAGSARFVFLSSIGVHGDGGHLAPLTAHSPVAATSAYTRSKLAAETLLRALNARSGASGMRSLILRPPVVYGVDCPGNVARLARAISAGWPLPLGAARNNRRSLVHVEALAQACLWACTSLSALGDTTDTPVWLPCDLMPVSTAAIIEALAMGMNRSPHLLPIPQSVMHGLLACAGKRRLAEQLFGSLEIDSSAMRDAGFTGQVDSLDGLRAMGAAYNRYS